MGKKTDKFLLLMWKNFLLQWRHPKQTIVEIMAPVLFSLLLVILRSLVKPVPHAAMFYGSYQGVLPFLFGYPIILTWSPLNPNLEEIMNDTVLGINERYYYNITDHNGFTDSQSLENYLTNKTDLGTILCGVQFDDLLAGNVELTQNISVTLRFPGELRNSRSVNGLGQNTWKTNLLYPVYQTGGPRTWDSNVGGQPRYQFEGFVYIQEEISLSITNYLKQKIHGEIFNRTATPVYMRRFPYPKWTEDLLLQALQNFLGLIIMLSFVYTCISTVKIITMEKERQLKEAMKIMGLPNWLHWTAWFLKTFIFLLISITIMLVLMKVRWYPETEYTIFTHSDPFVIFIFLVLYICTTITFCFAVSVFFSKANTAATVAGLTWFLSFCPFSFMIYQYDTLGLVQKLLACLLSNTTMAYGFQLILMFEGIEEGLQWHNIWRTVSPDDNLVFGHILVMLIIDSLMYLLIALYVETVFPGEYGAPQPWYFPFLKSYWCGRPTLEETEELEEPTIPNGFFENEPTDLPAAIKIQNLRKEFSNKVAVEDLALNLYKDQITVLLGHNGAGKTTTMSMLTGIIPPTRGTAIIDGYDIRKNMAQVRQSLGLCPQHNILFDELTVEEHLYFYSRLKGLDGKQAKAEIKKYVELLELVPKADSTSATLSGGMKRKLSVAVALCGDSSVVMCDEPTAGMDPSARRALWDLLQTQKRGRTILLTTHFMDEADLLGDRIAIMSGGKLQCSGSSYFLKKAYGAGYHLILDKSPQCNVNAVTKLIQKYIPHVEVESNVGSELTYILSEGQSTVFEEMLGELENNSAELGVSSYGISLTTLEEIYMKAGANHDSTEFISGKIHENEPIIKMYDSKSEEGNKGDIIFSDALNHHSSTIHLNSERSPLEGWTLYRNQFLAMLMKRSLSVLRSWILLIIQNCIPVLFLVITIIIIRNMTTYRDLPKLKIDLSSYDNPVTVVTRDRNNTYSQKYIDSLKKNKQALIDWKEENLVEKMLEETERNTTQVRQRYIVGATFKNSIITGWYNANPYHSAPLLLQLVMNAILQAEVSSDYKIEFYNHPLPFTIDTRLVQLTQGNNMGFQIAFNLGFSMAFVSSFYIMFYIRERVTKAKHLQFVSGLRVMPFWGAAFVCDFLTFIFTSLLVIVTIVAFQEDGFKTAEELGRLFSILLYFGFSMLPMMYLASYLFDVPSTGYTRMTLINIFTGVASFIVVQILSQPELGQENIANTLHWVLLLVPHYSLSTGIRNIHTIHSTHRMCDLFMANCMNLEATLEECRNVTCTSREACCTTTRNYYDWESPGIGPNVVYSICVGIFLFVILLAIEFGVFDRLMYKIREYQVPKEPPPLEESQTDNDVWMAQSKVRSASFEEINSYDLVLKDVSKYYKKFLAVNQLCLAVNKYECFGLLGINGAGKTTTFKIMTGDIPLSHGNAWINGLTLRTEMQKIRRFIGYCPQFDAVLDDLTCRETLIIFGLLRGVSIRESKFLAEDLSRQFDFHRHLDKKVKELSGGNKRKLSTAVAMVGDPLVLYLDEPTTGMDPATKRYLWNALCKLRDSGKCIILTSHSMEECEALCTRLAIMVNGVFKCLGSTQHLKSKFSEGYTLTIKIKKNNFRENTGSSTNCSKKSKTRRDPESLGALGMKISNGEIKNCENDKMVKNIAGITVNPTKVDEELNRKTESHIDNGFQNPKVELFKEQKSDEESKVKTETSKSETGKIASNEINEDLQQSAKEVDTPTEDTEPSNEHNPNLDYDNTTKQIDQRFDRSHLEPMEISSEENILEKSNLETEVQVLINSKEPSRENSETAETNTEPQTSESFDEGLSISNESSDQKPRTTDANGESQTSEEKATISDESNLRKLETLNEDNSKEQSAQVRKPENMETNTFLEKSENKSAGSVCSETTEQSNAVKFRPSSKTEFEEKENAKLSSSNGFSALSNTSVDVDVDSEVGRRELSASELIEKFVKNHFPGAVLRETHQELMTFYISDKSVKWSKMFGIMERAKKDLNIEDYSLGQCNLEQVFLSFTKYQREEGFDNRT